MIRFRLYSTNTHGYQLITFLLSALPLNISLLSREFPIGTLFRFSIPLIIQHVFYAIIFGMLPTQKKRKGVVLYRSFPARESLGLISYVTASQLLGLSPRTHFCYFLLVIHLVIFAN